MRLQPIQIFILLIALTQPASAAISCSKPVGDLDIYDSHFSFLEGSQVFGGTIYWFGQSGDLGTYRLKFGGFVWNNLHGRTEPTFEIWVKYPNSNEFVASGIGGTEAHNAVAAICGEEWANQYGPPAAPGPFDARRRAPVLPSSFGQAVQDFAGADLNGDGNPDTVDFTPSGVRVRLKNINNQFTSTQTFPAGITPEQGFSTIMLADFNGDGKLDAAVTVRGDGTNNPGKIAVLPGNGNGTFGTAKVTSTGSYVYTMAAADFNGDGKTDLVVGTGVGNSVLFFAGVGDGTFAAPVSNTTAGRATSLVAADLNNDGRPDVAVIGSFTVGALVNQGNGQFATAINTAIPVLANYLAFSDVNHDGKPDLLVASTSSNSVMVLIGNGNGQFQPPVAYVAGNYPESIAVLPLEDGTTMVFTPDSLTTQGVGMFLNALGRAAAPRYRFIGGSPSSVATATLNADSQPDILVANGNLVTIVTGTGQVFGAPTTYQIGDAVAVATGDFNSDGKQDAVTAGGTSVKTFLGRGDGTLQNPLSTTAGQNSKSITVADFNRDGKLDVAVATDSGINILLGRGDGGFTGPTNITISGLRPTAVYAADFNGDGKQDVVAIMSNGNGAPLTVGYFAGNGDGTFVAGRTTPTNRQDSDTAKMTVGDLNGDGKLDIAYATLFQFGLVFGDGAGGFTQASPNPATYGGATGVAITDLNGDGKQDLVISHCCGEADGTYLLGRGDGTFQTEAHFPSGSSPKAVVAIQAGPYRLPGLVVVAKGEPGAFNTTDATASGTVVMVAPLFDDSALAPSITSPASGSTLTSSSITFIWGPVNNATKYKLEIGSATGGADLFTQETTATSLTVSNLPTDGRTLYAQLTAFVNGAYGTPTTYTYRAFTRTTPLRFVPLPPCRLMETRTAYNFEGRTGAFAPPTLNAQETRTLNLPDSNVCSIPATAKAYVVNVTLIPNGGGVSYATVWPAGEARPNTWTIRSPDGQIVANSAIVKAGTSGGISVFTSDRTDMLIDISGYYTDSTAVSGLAYYPLTPCRVVETRADYRSPAGPFGPPSMAARQTRSFRLPSTSYCTVPNAAAYSVTITVVPPGALAYLTAWPNGSSQPNVSSINSFAGRVLANSVIIPASANGTIDVFTFDATDFIIDINGYYAPDDGTNGQFYFPVTQCRASDSTVSGGAYPDDTVRTIQIPTASGCSGIPTNARGYAINVTALPSGNPMPFLTAYPTGQPRPNASILNAFQGQIVSNAAIVPAGTNGAIDIYAFRRTDVVVEVSGYFGR